MSVEKLARILHESGREAVEQRKIYRDDVPVEPFCEWDELPEPAKEGRRMMARYLVGLGGDVIGEAFQEAADDAGARVSTQHVGGGDEDEEGADGNPQYLGHVGVKPPAPAAKTVLGGDAGEENDDEQDSPDDNGQDAGNGQQKENPVTESDKPNEETPVSETPDTETSVPEGEPTTEKPAEPEAPASSEPTPAS